MNMLLTRGVLGLRSSANIAVLEYVSAVGCIGALVIARSVWQVTTQPFDSHWLWLAGLTVASSAAVLRQSSLPVAFSISEIFTFSAALLFGPEAGALTVAVDCGVISVRLAMRRALPMRRLILNVTAPPLAMWIAAHLLFATVDVGLYAREPLRFAELVLPLSACAIVYYLLDTWMVAVAVALDERRQVWPIWRDNFAQLWVSFLVGAHAAGLILIARGGSGLSFLAIVAPLPILLYYAMHTWIARMNDRVRHFQEATEQARLLHEQQRLQLQTEAALRERDSQFRAVFDYALDALLLVDNERRMVDANPAACALLGVTRSALPAVPIDAFLVRPSRDELVAQWKTILAGGKQHGELNVNVARRERVIEFSFKANVVPNHHLFMWRDVSDRKRLEAELQQSQKMETVGRLAGGVAHDFNNLLTVILGNAGIILDRDLRSAKAEVQDILDAALRAAALTRQLLAFSRKQVLQASVVNLNGLVNGVESMLRRLLDQSIELHSAMDPAVWPVKVDVTQLEQVILNLAVNARDAMPDGGKLLLTTANVEVGPKTFACGGAEMTPGKYVRLTVTDTGTGMDAATLAQIFEPFFTTKAQDRGTGLGLAMVYGIVRQSGGQIAVESTPGVGSSFHVYLPRVEEPTAIDGIRAADATVRLDGTETVLLVEDEASLRGLAERMLSAYGYEVLAAGSGDEACRLVAARHGAIDILVTDLAMPQMNGRELVTVLRSRIAGLRVVFMSGHGDPNVALQGAPGQTAFVQKPFTDVDLAQAVRALLDAEPAALD